MSNYEEHSSPLGTLGAPSILDLVDMGWSIIPIKKGTKQPPKGFKWGRYRYEAASREQIEEWQEEYGDCNWAVVTGKVSGIMAVSVGSGAAQHWVDEMGTFFKHASPVWYTTERRCGWQYLFRLPPNMCEQTIVYPHPGVEIRINGHYSLIPPSIYGMDSIAGYPNGARYKWQRFSEDIPDAPEWCLAILQVNKKDWTHWR